MREIAELEGESSKITDYGLASGVLAIMFGGSSAVILLLTALCLEREPPRCRRHLP
jgi:hypothetical protein